MGRERRKQIEEIEETQKALRESIEQAKELAGKAQQLLQDHKDAIENPPNESQSS